jgi:hypothetical protein
LLTLAGHDPTEDRPHRDDDSLRDLERGDPERASVHVVEDQARLAVDARGAVCDSALACLTTPADERFSRRARPRRGRWHGGRLAAAVAVDSRVRGEQLDERVRVALLPRGDEAAGDLVPLLARDVEAAPSLLHVAVGAGEDLSAVVRVFPTIRAISS